MNDKYNSRLNLLAGLIHDARESTGRIADDCAEVLGIPVEDYLKIEAAESSISLPELEVLAMFLQVPMAYFWGSISLETAEQPNFELYVSLRQRIIGTLLNQARMETGIAQEELADSMGIDSKRITTYVSGEAPIPYVELEQIAEKLGVTLQQLSDEEHGPLARSEKELQLHRRFDELPSEIRAFVVEPINLGYLETAMRLSKMEVDKLRAIAEGILDITL